MRSSAEINNIRSKVRDIRVNLWNAAPSKISCRQTKYIKGHPYTLHTAVTHTHKILNTQNSYFKLTEVICVPQNNIPIYLI